MTDRSRYRYQPPVTYRTQEEADVLLVEAREIVDEIRRRLPAHLFEVSGGTLFVARQIPEEVACFALTLPDLRGSLTAVSFELGGDFEDTVDAYVQAAWRWRKKCEHEAAESTPAAWGSTNESGASASEDA